jgi:hypothetical protein
VPSLVAFSAIYSFIEQALRGRFVVADRPRMRNRIVLRVFATIGVLATCAVAVVGSIAACGPRGVLIAGLAAPALSHSAACRGDLSAYVRYESLTYSGIQGSGAALNDDPSRRITPEAARELALAYCDHRVTLEYKPSPHLLRAAVLAPDEPRVAYEMWVVSGDKKLPLAQRMNSALTMLRRNPADTYAAVLLMTTAYSGHDRHLFERPDVQQALVRNAVTHYSAHNVERELQVAVADAFRERRASDRRVAILGARAAVHEARVLGVVRDPSLLAFERTGRLP